MINRKKGKQELHALLRQFPVVAILGPRQCGKTTLARQIPFQHYFDLENPRDLARLENPQLTLESLSGLVVIDEIQRKPELFPLLRYLVDQKKQYRYLILGSASRDLIRQSSESLAGRIGYLSLKGFSLDEVGGKNKDKLWQRGGFPKSYLASSNNQSLAWRENYITTFLERDIPNLGIQIPAATLRRFWVMISHYHGQVINFSEIGRSFGISDMTVRRYLEILAGTFMVRLLQPWHVNTTKRLVKNPKIYIRDSGLFHSLQTIPDLKVLASHPKLGASWEGFVLEQFCELHLLKDEEVFFWATHAGAEADLFFQYRGKNYAIEMKFADAPTLTKSMRIACVDLDLSHLWIIYPGKQKYALDKKITVCPIDEIGSLIKDDPAFLARVESARKNLRAGKGVRLEDIDE